MHGPVLKDVWVSAHSRNHVICLRRPKCLITLVFDDVDLPYCTSKVEHIVTFTAVFRTPDRNCAKFGRFGNVFRWFFTFYRHICQPYFYFRFVWFTELESIPHALTPTSIIPTKFVVDMTIYCRVIAFLSADTSCDLVTLTFDFWLWAVVIHGRSRGQPCH